MPSLRTHSLHTCQPSRIRRDSPAFSSDVPRPAKLPIILHFCLVTQQSDELPIKLGPYFARRQTASIFHARQPSSTLLPLLVSDVPWVVDSDWNPPPICQRSADMLPKRKCKFNDDWRRDFDWIAKLPVSR